MRAALGDLAPIEDDHLVGRGHVRNGAVVSTEVTVVQPAGNLDGLISSALRAGVHRARAAGPPNP
ncbi:MAG: hypothetical protein JWR24_5368 [Actinoallomurus sp.]|nr:hypothetical protein [Actinoallomurus sp.]